MFYIKSLLTAGVSGMAYLLGGWDLGLQILITMVCLDYVTGIMEAIYTKTFHYNTGILGIIKKVGIFIVVMVAFQIENLTGQKDLIHPIVCYGFAINEDFSILKNLKQIGVAIPDIFYNQVKKLSDDTKPPKDGGGENG